jgi:hypothetical protein
MAPQLTPRRSAPPWWSARFVLEVPTGGTRWTFRPAAPLTIDRIGDDFRDALRRVDRALEPRNRESMPVI